MSDPDYQIIVFEARVLDDDESGGDMIQLLLPLKDDIDAVLGTERWIIRQAESENLVGGACGDIGLE